MNRYLMPVVNEAEAAELPDKDSFQQQDEPDTAEITMNHQVVTQ